MLNFNVCACDEPYFNLLIIAFELKNKFYCKYVNGGILESRI